MKFFETKNWEGENNVTSLPRNWIERGKAWSTTIDVVLTSRSMSIDRRWSTMIASCDQCRSSRSRVKKCVYRFQTRHPFWSRVQFHLRYFVIAFIVEAYLISYWPSYDCSLTNLFTKPNSSHLDTLVGRRLNMFKSNRSKFLKIKIKKNYFKLKILLKYMMIIRLLNIQRNFINYNQRNYNQRNYNQRNYN